MSAGFMDKIMPTQDYQQQIENLIALIARMAGLAEAQLAAASDALQRRDAGLGRRVHGDDRQIDHQETVIEAEATRLLLLQTPSSENLQEILGAIKIAGELERVGDYSANIAKRVVRLASLEGLPRLGTLHRMGRLVQAQLADVINAYAQRDLNKAIDAWERDDELDDLYTSLYREMLTYMMEDPRNITGYTHFLFIAKNFERIGDHATNIAEIIHVLITGRPLEKTRVKADTTPHFLPQE
jgi:phosphate transport system protein